MWACAIQGLDQRSHWAQENAFVRVFEWNSGFETGQAEVDEQHRRLVTLINDFGDVMSQGGASPAGMNDIYQELISYTGYHFAAEERLMKFHALDETYVLSHRLAHHAFVQKVVHMHAGMSSGNDHAVAEDMMEFLVNWLAHHILVSDMSMARQIVAIGAGKNARSAYLDEEQEADRSKGPLITALNNLFSQVTHHNRRLLELNRTLESKVEERTHALRVANQRLEELASTDALTGLPNRRHALLRVAELWDEATRSGTPLACMMVDADGFKHINDTYGHEAGDVVLRELARHILHAIRTDDLVCRLGGDEFLVICPNTSAEGAQRIAQTVREKVFELRIPVGDGEWRGSISIGVAASNEHTTCPEDVIKAADRSVYAAKAAGKNCVRSSA